MACPPRLFCRALCVFIIAIFFVTCAAKTLPAESADYTRILQPRDLSDKWLIRSGDDPAFARTDFDDSQWTVFDPATSLTRIYAAPQRIVWYRMHIKVDPASPGLSLNEWNISRAFEIYVNGEPLITLGQVKPYVPYTSLARMLARIPDRVVSSGSIVIALRVHISPAEWGSGQNPGFYVSNLAIGQYDTLYRQNWLQVVGENAGRWIDRLLFAGIGFVALVLFAAQRSQREYLWIFAAGAMSLVQFPEPFIGSFHNLPEMWEFLTIAIRIASPFVFVSLYFSFVHKRVGWGWRIYLIFAGITNVLAGLDGYYLSMPAWLQLCCNLPFIILLSVVVPIVLAVYWRRGNREAGILLIPVLLFSLYIYAEVVLGTLFQFPGSKDSALRALNLIDRYPAGPFAVSLDNVSGILSTLSLTLIMLLRSMRTSRRQAQLESELEAAQQVQQVLLPEQIPAVAGFTVESVYQPAQQVGGDFFQILPAGEGGLLVVIGDVAGKGLPAAMLVSVLVGAIRGVAEYTKNPAELLSNLNERLVGRGSGGGFSTALAAHIGADGSVAIANAGHLSPYLNGEEVTLPGALPLGVVAGAAYETTEFFLAPGSRLTFYSDGVVEAQNAKGELFGFDRSRDLSTQPADVIVESAKRFGQQDDITVVTIERNVAIATAA